MPTLPVTGRTVLVLTPQARPVRFLPKVRCYRLIPLGALPDHWPGAGHRLVVDAETSLAPSAGPPRDVEPVRRTGESGTYLFAIDHTAPEAKVPLGASGTGLLTGEAAAGRPTVPTGAARVVRLDG
ncbi:hypothetical protein GCM10010358_31930 [Streptomyces minutiscleroticus]|uniref:Beta-galactosidase C-terminal domain-containing protein n=1 Tax=Streptomyces minutiscleroticus TaxID=68238 RepID=A0A918KVK7_9ACTN|nr:hypothetical protein GCM10010358_31930 [Streptomyces minutiscleroticus]